MKLPIKFQSIWYKSNDLDLKLYLIKIDQGSKRQQIPTIFTFVTGKTSIMMGKRKKNLRRRKSLKQLYTLDYEVEFLE